MKHEQPAAVVEEDKNPAAVELGRLGGLAPREGARGFAKLTPAQRKKLAQKGARAKWEKEKAS